jgi:hypothetical protein
MGTQETLRALDLIVDLLALVDPAIGFPAREGLLIAKELLDAGDPDPVATMRALRVQIRADWRAALAAKFGPPGEGSNGST